MTVAELTMPTHEADKAFRDYRAACRRRATMDDVAMMRAYRCLSRRQRVIDLIQAMQLAGVDEQKRPRLAIVRADAELVYCRVDQDGSAQFAVTSGARANASASTVVRLPPATFPARSFSEARVECRARVPSIQRGPR